MKYLLVFSFVFVFAGAAMAVDFVDIGDPTSEAGHNLISWGPVEPLTHGGSYGGVDDCRAIWTNFDTPVPASVDAYIDLNFAGGPELVSFVHLSGPADDSFEIWIGNNMVFVYNDPNNPGESWYASGFNYTPAAAGVVTLRIEAIGAAWGSWGTYGQVCFDEFWVGPGGPVATETDSWGGVKALFR